MSTYVDDGSVEKDACVIPEVFNKFVMYGHRGAMGEAPENTLEAFELALSQGAHALECDVILCSTGEPVIIHDLTVNRTTNGKGFVCDHTFDELRNLDAGNGNKIPTVQEMIQHFGLRTVVNFELKGPSTGAVVAKAILKAVEEGLTTFNNVVVSSFNHNELNVFASYCPMVARGAILEGCIVNFAEYLRINRFHFVSLHAEWVTEDLVREIHNVNRKVFVFGYNQLSSGCVHRLVNLHVDGLFSNYPGKQFQMLNEKFEGITSKNACVEA